MKKFWGALAVVILSCKPGDIEITGRWTNESKQILVIEEDLSGRLTQTGTCTPELNVTIHRDPLDAYAIQFVPNQEIYFPLEQRALFAPNEYFCSSKDSTPMCRFCRLEDGVLECDATEQKITGRGAQVTHDCSWTRTMTASVTPASCPDKPDGGTSCRAVAVITGGDPDAGVSD